LRLLSIFLWVVPTGFASMVWFLGMATTKSAFVQHAVANALFDAAGWNEMLEDALQQTGGPLTKEERDWADTALSPER